MSSSMHSPVESNSIEKKCWGYYVDVKFHVDSISATFNIIFQWNLDEHSPAAMVHMQNVLDIGKCTRLPESEELKTIGNAAAETAHSRYGWEKLVDRLVSADQTVQVGGSEQ